MLNLKYCINKIELPATSLPGIVFRRKCWWKWIDAPECV